MWDDEMFSYQWEREVDRLSGDMQREIGHRLTEATRLRAELKAERAALEAAYKLLGELGAAYEGPNQWEICEQVKSALRVEELPNE